MSFHPHYIEYKNCIQDILIPLLSLVNIFTYAGKGQWSGGIFNSNIFVLYMDLNLHNLIFISFPNLHSIYKLFKMPCCKKIMFLT